MAPSHYVSYGAPYIVDCCILIVLNKFLEIEIQPSFLSLPRGKTYIFCLLRINFKYFQTSLKSFIFDTFSSA